MGTCDFQASSSQSKQSAWILWEIVSHKWNQCCCYHVANLTEIAFHKLAMKCFVDFVEIIVYNRGPGCYHVRILSYDISRALLFRSFHDVSDLSCLPPKFQTCLGKFLKSSFMQCCWRWPSHGFPSPQQITAATIIQTRRGRAVS